MPFSTAKTYGSLLEELALRNNLGCLSGIAPLQPTGSVAFVLIVVQLDVGKCACA